MAAQSDMAERARRLTAHKEATTGKVFSEVEPGVWRYVTLTPDELPQGIGDWLTIDRHEAADLPTHQGLGLLEGLAAADPPLRLGGVGTGAGGEWAALRAAVEGATGAGAGTSRGPLRHTLGIIFHDAI